MKNLILFLTITVGLNCAVQTWPASGMLESYSIDQTLLSTEVTFDVKSLNVETGLLAASLEVANGTYTAEIYLDGSGNLMFSDEVTSPVSLATLAAGGGSSSSVFDTFEVYKTPSDDTKEALLTVDNLQFNFLSDGPYFGNKRISNTYFTVYNEYPSGVDIATTTSGSATSWNHLAISGTGQYIIAVGSGGVDTVVTSADYGDTWTEVNAGDGNCCCMSVDGKHQMFYTYADGIYVSSDFGTTFVKRLTLTASFKAMACTSDGKFSVIVGDSVNPYYSNDFGLTWSSLSTFPSATRTLYGLAMSTDGKHIYAVDATGPRFYYSHDKGATWSYSEDANIPNFTSSALCCSDDGKFIYGSKANAICISRDYGATWVTNTDLGSITQNGMTCTPSGQVILTTCASTSKVYYSKDWGETFTDTEYAAHGYHSIVINKTGSRAFVGVDGDDIWVEKGLIYSTQGIVFSEAVVINGKLSVSGNLAFEGGTFTFNNSGGAYNAAFGTKNSAYTLFTDGTNDRVGIGTNAPNAILDVEGNIFPTTDNSYYLGKNDDDTPFAWKGVILKDTTNGTYYRIEVTNGSIVATDLTD